MPIPRPLDGDLAHGARAREGRSSTPAMAKTPEPTLLFTELGRKPVVVTFDQRQGSSDGGALLLRTADRQLRVIERLAACLPDARQSGKVAHTLADLLAQRLYGIACGYADANDAARPCP